MLNAIVLAVQFFPFVIQLILMLNTIFPQAKIGPFKLSIAINIAMHVFTLLKSGTFNEEGVRAILPKLISDAVTDLNATPAAWSPTVPVVVPAVVSVA